MQYQYTGWPDDTALRDCASLLKLRNAVRQRLAMGVTQSPLLVHCNSGVGRTGTFVAVDMYVYLSATEEKEITILIESSAYIVCALYINEHAMAGTTSISFINVLYLAFFASRLLEDVEDKGQINVFDVVSNLRKQRYLMVENLVSSMCVCIHIYVCIYAFM